jgi:hypothetical protein
MPKVTQLSVSMENKPGALARICAILAKEGINLSAVLAPEMKERCKIRVLVDDVSKAEQALQANKLRFSKEDVVFLTLDNRPGALAEVSEKLAAAKINIKYAYATVAPASSKATVVFAVPNVAKALEVLGG